MVHLPRKRKKQEPGLQVHKHLGEIVTYGADAESLDKLLGQAVERYRAAEATLAKIAERVYSVDGPVREVTLRMALNDILNLASGETT